MGEKLVTIHMNIHLPVVVERKEKWFVSFCPVLDVCSQGATEEEAKKNLTEALVAFLISCHKRGTLDAVLKRCGFVADPSALRASRKVDNSDYIDVPLPFIIDMDLPRRCHA